MRFPSWLAALTLATGALSAQASPLAEVTVYDRADGRELPVYWHEGRRYVAGEPGHEYDIRIRSLSGQRLLAVTSVDGVNVLDGRTAAPDQSGYLVNAWGQTRIEGWRKSLDEVASFYFTRLPDSYAARTGRPDDVGVIGVALFRERAVVPPPQPCCRHYRDEDDGRARSESAPSAPAEERESASARSGDASGSMAPQARKSERLGTGHGQRLDSAVRYVDFERADAQPDEVISIWYDSRSRLLAQGVIPTRHARSRHRPQPFPAGFVPDP